MNKKVYTEDPICVQARRLGRATNDSGIRTK